MADKVTPPAELRLQACRNVVKTIKTVSVSLECTMQRPSLVAFLCVRLFLEMHVGVEMFFAASMPFPS